MKTCLVILAAVIACGGAASIQDQRQKMMVNIFNFSFTSSPLIAISTGHRSRLQSKNWSY
jgi:hypothetical protein